MARTKFDKAVLELESVKGNYAEIWRLRSAKFPIILIDVLSKSGNPAVLLCLNLENWDFLPPYATILSLDTRRNLLPENVPGAIENAKDPVNHVVYNQQKGKLWFCSPGFYEYHEFYPEDRWELIRNTDNGKISWIIERACNLIDRARFN